MGRCFGCCGPSKSKKDGKKRVDKGSPVSVSHNVNIVNAGKSKSPVGSDSKKEKTAPNNTVQIPGHTFTYSELAAATENFREECLLGEGGFGRVHKGRLESTGEVVAVKQLNRNGHQGNREFIVEVFMLRRLHHPNLVNLIGYCTEGDHRLLVYEFMPLGSLEKHLHGVKPGMAPLDWSTRIKIATGAAKGLEYLHDKATPSVIYRDLKSSNILLGKGYHPKLSDFGLAKIGPVGGKSHVTTRVMGTFGYCAPEYAMTGQLTQKSDVYSFGVLLLELITGRKAYTNSRAAVGAQYLVNWARPQFKDKNGFHRMADPLLEGRYPRQILIRAVGIAARCLHEQPSSRPRISEVANALSYLASITYDHSAASSSSEIVGPSCTVKNGDHLKKPRGGPRSLDEIEYGGRLIFRPPHQKKSPVLGLNGGLA